MMVEEEKTVEKKTSRKISVFSTKKKIASKVGETKLGRSTVIKLVGNEGNEIISALKSAVTKVDTKENAKQMKKDLIKWLLKISVLIQNKSLRMDEIRKLRRPIQIAMEKLIDVVERDSPGKRDLSVVSKDLRDLGVMLQEMLNPHAQDKNLDKVDRLINFYSDEGFLTRLFNEEELAEDGDRVIEAVRNFLLPLPSALYDEESILMANARAKVLQLELNSPDLGICFDKGHPEFVIMFCQYLESEPGNYDQAFRFLLAEKEFSQISSLSLRGSRAEMLQNKFFHPETGIAKLVAMDVDVDVASDKRVSKNIFEDIREKLMKKLRPRFRAFLSSDPKYMDYLQKIKAELKEIQNTYGDKLE